MTRNRILVAILAIGLLCINAWASAITPEQAVTFARTWRTLQSRTSREKGNPSVRTVRGNADRTLFHAVNMPEGGFVIIAGDTDLGSVVAFSDTGTFEDKEGTPLYDILVADMSGRISNADGYSKRPKSVGEDGLETLSDIRVAPITQAKWSQGTFGLGNAFNLYTPNNAPCGCVATAFITVMRHWCEPKTAVAPMTKMCWIGSSKTERQMIGGTYDWDMMPLEQSYDTTDEERAAIGKLAYDMSLAMHTWYGNTASAAYGELAAKALATDFGYANVQIYDNYSANLDSKNILSSKEYRNAILASLDAGMPVVVGIAVPSVVEHEVVIDGYGYTGSGSLFCHLNCGWTGQADLWYNIIAVGVVDPYFFNVIEDVSYNIHPTVTGDVISGRVLTESGLPVPGVTVKMVKSGSKVEEETVTNDKGMFSFRFTGMGTFNLSASDSTYGSALRKVVVDAASEDTQYDFDEDSYNLLLGADRNHKKLNLGVVANRWGEDLVLKEGGYTEPPFTADNAAVFDGCVLSGDDIKGTIQVKAAKVKKGESKLTASLVLTDKTKKLSYRGVMDVETGLATLSCKGEEDIEIRLGETQLVGEMSKSGRQITGVRNLFSSKDKKEVAQAESLLAPHIGTLNAVGDGTVLAITVAKKGKVKVAGTYNGQKVSVSVQAYVDADGNIYAPVVVAKKNVSLSFLLTLSDAGASIIGLGDEIKVGKQGKLGANPTFKLPDGAFSFVSGVREELLPYEEPITVVKGKWTMPKGAKVTYKNGQVTLAPAKKGGPIENPSALTLSYKEKDGTFKGSFKVYAIQSGKLKKLSASVTGVLVDGVGYGSALINKVGSCSVTIE